MLSQTHGLEHYRRKDTFYTNTNMLQTKLYHTLRLGQGKVVLQNKKKEKGKKRDEQKKVLSRILISILWSPQI